VPEYEANLSPEFVIKDETPQQLETLATGNVYRMELFGLMGDLCIEPLYEGEALDTWFDNDLTQLDFYSFHYDGDSGEEIEFEQVSAADPEIRNTITITVPKNTWTQRSIPSSAFDNIRMQTFAERSKFIEDMTDHLIRFS
jgi:hypothetical protein